MTTFTPNVTKAVAADELRELLKDSMTVHVLTRSVSRSGMSRRMSLFVVDAANAELVDVTTRVAAVLGYKMYSEDHTIRVNGAGMDMQYHIVYSLSRELYREIPADQRPRIGGVANERDAGYILTKRTI